MPVSNIPMLGDTFWLLFINNANIKYVKIKYKMWKNKTWKIYWK